MSEDVNDPQQKPRKKMGRPTKYSDELAAIILTRIAEGESLNKITKEDGMPSHATVYLWLLQKPDFSESYVRAREDQAETLADEIVAIADAPPAEITDDKGVTRTDSGWVTWQRNRVDARKWVAAKLKPKKYGDRLTHAGDAENPVAVKTDLTVFETILQNLELQKQK
jgi:hypothetical protein